ncbi:MAG: hypothetical protein WAL23_07730 [Nitrososphaeraceae archaeon]
MEFSTTTLALIAIISALGLIGVVVIDFVTPLQEAEAKGCRTSQAVNASKGRCIQL